MTPLVTAVLPTRGRPVGAAIALACIRLQTWPNVEIVILDDWDDPSFEGQWSDVAVYQRCKTKSLGEKLNLIRHVACGDYIVHFYDDDVSLRCRIEDQVNRLIESGKAITSYRNLRFTDGKKTWVTHNWPGGYGTSFCYRRDWLQTHYYPHVDSEDWEFVSEAMRAGAYIEGDAGDKMLCAITHNCKIGPGWEEITHLC